jgi:hypothetical protein
MERSITVDGDSAIVRRMQDPDLHWQFTRPAHVKGLAHEVHEAVRAGSRASIWVTPVIVVWRVHSRGEGRNLQVCAWRRSRSMA